MDSAPAKPAHPGRGWVAGVLLTVAGVGLVTYAVLPMAIVYPVYRVYDGTIPNPVIITMSVVFYPHTLVARAHPRYGRWLLAQAAMLGMH